MAPLLCKVDKFATLNPSSWCWWDTVDHAHSHNPDNFIQNITCFLIGSLCILRPQVRWCSSRCQCRFGCPNKHPSMQGRVVNADMLCLFIHCQAEQHVQSGSATTRASLVFDHLGSPTFVQWECRRAMLRIGKYWRLSLVAIEYILKPRNRVRAFGYNEIEWNSS